MNNHSFSDGEWKLMNLLWDESPLTISKMVSALKTDTGWGKATINIMLNRLADKGAVRIETGGRSKLFYPITGRSDAVRSEAKSTLSRIKTGSLALLVSTMTEESDLSDAEIEELVTILRKGREEK
jgi:BlaI family penicillinase repressor